MIILLEIRSTSLLIQSMSCFVNFKLEKLLQMILHYRVAFIKIVFKAHIYYDYDYL